MLTHDLALYYDGIESSKEEEDDLTRLKEEGVIAMFDSLSSDDRLTLKKDQSEGILGAGAAIFSGRRDK